MAGPSSNDPTSKSPAFNRDFDPTHGEVVELSPRIRRVVAPNPNAFTFTGTGVYLIGRGDVAVIDPGPRLGSHLDAVEAALDPGERIGHILITHTHSDHTAGVPDLVARTGAPTYGFGPHGPVPDTDPLEAISFDDYFTAEEQAAIYTAWAETPEELRREGPDTDFVPDVAVADGDRLHSPEGDWTIEVVHTPGHTSNHVCFALAEERVLFTGDHVMGWATSVISPPDGDLFEYMASLDKLLARDDLRYWPTHGPPIEDPQTYVRDFIAHRRGREAQIVAGLALGPSTIRDLVPAMYANTTKQLWRAAANSVYAHLLDLHRQGRVRPAGEAPTITATWHLV